MKRPRSVGSLGSLPSEPKEQSRDQETAPDAHYEFVGQKCSDQPGSSSQQADPYLEMQPPPVRLRGLAVHDRGDPLIFPRRLTTPLEAPGHR